MQTFLPYENFREAVSVLDRQRLGKQRVETLQIAKSLMTDSGWSNHPATKMWANHLEALMAYQTATCNEWVNNRGYKDTCLLKTAELLSIDPINQEDLSRDQLPDWLGMEDFHASHRSNLLRKNIEWYGQFWPDEPDDLEYIWPSRIMELVRI